jgi:hypothetical protein
MHANAQLAFSSYWNAWKERLLGRDRGCDLALQLQAKPLPEQ